MTTQWRPFGLLSRAHGIKGGIKAKLYNPEGRLLEKGITLLAGEKEFEVQRVQWGNHLILYLKNIEERTQVEELTPIEFFIKRSDFPDLEEDEFYVEDLVGLKVIDLNGDEKGEITHHYDNGAQVVLGFDYEGEKWELPFIDAYFPEIDQDGGEIQVVLPEVIE